MSAGRRGDSSSLRFAMFQPHDLPIFPPLQTTAHPALNPKRKSSALLRVLSWLSGVYRDKPRMCRCIIQDQMIVPPSRGTMPDEAAIEPLAANSPVMNSWKTTTPQTTRTKVVGHASPLAEAGLLYTMGAGMNHADPSTKDTPNLP